MDTDSDYEEVIQEFKKGGRITKRRIIRRKKKKGKKKKGKKRTVDKNLRYDGSEPFINPLLTSLISKSMPTQSQAPSYSIISQDYGQAKPENLLKSKEEKKEEKAIVPASSSSIVNPSYVDDYEDIRKGRQLFEQYLPQQMEFNKQISQQLQQMGGQGFEQLQKTQEQLNKLREEALKKDEIGKAFSQKGVEARKQKAEEKKKADIEKLEPQSQPQKKFAGTSDIMEAFDKFKFPTEEDPLKKEKPLKNIIDDIEINKIIREIKREMTQKMPEELPEELPLKKSKKQIDEEMRRYIEEQEQKLREEQNIYYTPQPMPQPLPQEKREPTTNDKRKASLNINLMNAYKDDEQNKQKYENARQRLKDIEKMYPDWDFYNKRFK